MRVRRKRRNRAQASSVAGRSEKSFLDTSVAIKLLTGHTEHRRYLENAVPRPWYVNNYVRMEFYRATLILWIDLYFESGEAFHPTFGQALLYFADKFGRGPKAVLNAIGNIISDSGFDLGDPSEKEVCRQKLQDMIFSIALAFEQALRDDGCDPTRCTRVKEPLRFRFRDMREKSLQDVVLQFHDVTECRRECNIESIFRGKPSGALTPRISKLKDLDAARASDLRTGEAVIEADLDPTAITCSLCEKMGDAVIACALQPNWRLHSLDFAHEKICARLGLKCTIHPSLSKIRAAAGATPGA